MSAGRLPYPLVACSEPLGGIYRRCTDPPQRHLYVSPILPPRAECPDTLNQILYQVGARQMAHKFVWERQSHHGQRLRKCMHFAFAQITQQFTAGDGIFGGSLAHSQQVFVALLIDSYGDQKDMLCHMNSVEHQHTELEGIQPTLKELLDLRSGSFDEAATHRALAGSEGVEVIGQRLQRASVLPRADSHQHLRGGALVEWICLGRTV